MYNVAIEGNIGAGKSTFLDYISKKFPNRVNIYCEPVHRWRNVNGTNLFDLMYKDPKRYGFIFQSYVQLTMLEMHDEIAQTQANLPKASSKEERTEDVILKDVTNQDQKIENEKKRKSSQNDSQIKKNKSSNIVNTNQTDELNDEEITKSKQTYSVNMMERSIFSARYIFVENLFQNDLLSDIEYKILDDTFLFLIKKQNIKLDLIIYLRSTPLQCYKRMLMRQRPEETQTLQLENFKKFHQLHEDFLIGENSLIRKVLDVPVLVIDTMDSKEKMFRTIDEHSLFLMNDLNKSECLTEIACDGN